MQRVGVYILGLLFSGSTALVVGSVLNSLKRSLAPPLRLPPAESGAAARRQLSAEREPKRVPVPEQVSPAVASTPAGPAEKPGQSQGMEASRPGRNKKRAGRSKPFKRGEEKNRRAARRRLRGKKAETEQVN
jgi:hypothetical protein